MSIAKILKLHAESVEDQIIRKNFVRKYHQKPRIFPKESQDARYQNKKQIKHE